VVRAAGEASVWLKRLVVVCGIVAFTLVGLTALDSHDERRCRQNPTLVAWSRIEPPLPVSDGMPAPAVIPTHLQPLSLPDICDGFLPW
jgi:hypothetical protein